MKKMILILSLLFAHYLQAEVSEKRFAHLQGLNEKSVIDIQELMDLENDEEVSALAKLRAEKLSTNNNYPLDYLEDQIIRTREVYGTTFIRRLRFYNGIVVSNLLLQEAIEAGKDGDEERKEAIQKLTQKYQKDLDKLHKKDLKDKENDFHFGELARYLGAANKIIEENTQVPATENTPAIITDSREGRSRELTERSRAYNTLISQ